MIGFIDPPGAFAPAEEWEAFLSEMRKLPASPDTEIGIKAAE
jgi:hypothetical protein